MNFLGSFDKDCALAPEIIRFWGLCGSLSGNFFHFHCEAG